MLDIRLIRQSPEELEQRLRTKDSTISLAPLLSLDKEVRALKTESERLVAQKRGLSDQIREIKKNSPERLPELLNHIEALSSRIKELEEKLSSTEAEFLALLSCIPNIPDHDIPISPGKEGNVVFKTVGEKRNFDFSPLHHVDLNQKLDLFDFKSTAKTSGSGWVAFKGLGAQLEWALLSYMLDKQISKGFTFWLPPLAVKEEILFGSGQIPKFVGQFYPVVDGDKELFLIPTSEVVLNGFHSNEILEEGTLPLKYVAFSPCFRREAGAAGANERGLVRMHQFHKIEMFSFATPETEDAVFQMFLDTAEEILQDLGLHYQLSLLSTGDMSFTATKTVDVEVWLPGQNAYYEVSSISKCGDYQARRSNTRYKNKKGKLCFARTLNGSGLATPRLFVALLENYQQKDGSVIIPEVLRPYLGNTSVLSATR